MEQPLPDVLVQKLSKIINLATDKGATEGEAIAALGKAREMLKKYNISLEEFKEKFTGDKGQDASSVIKMAIFKVEKRKWNVWIELLAQAVSVATNTKPYYHGGTIEIFNNKMQEVRTMYFAGSPIDLGVAKVVMNFLYLAANEFMKIHNRYEWSKFTTSQRNLKKKSFLYGFAEKCCKLMEESRESEKQSPDEKWEIIVFNKEALIKQYIEKQGLVLKKAKPARVRIDPDAYIKGGDAAEKVLSKNTKELQ